MFIKKSKNRNNSIGVKVISKKEGKYKLFGSGKTEEKIEFLYQRARQYIHGQKATIKLFVERDDVLN
jgi:hypothetical protein